MGERAGFGGALGLALAVALAGASVGCGGERPVGHVKRPRGRAAAEPLLRPKSLPDADGVDPAVRRGLEGVARCFHRAVTVLQGEPAAGPAALGVFLRRAVATGKVARACAGVRFGKGLLQNVEVRVGDRAVAFSRFTEGEDVYGGGRTVLHIRYSFRCAGRPARASVTIQRQLGGR